MGPAEKGRNVPAWQCQGPGADEVVSLPYSLAAVLVLEHHCEAKQPNSCMALCDACWAERRRGELQ